MVKLGAFCSQTNIQTMTIWEALAACIFHSLLIITEFSLISLVKGKETGKTSVLGNWGNRTHHYKTLLKNGIWGGGLFSMFAVLVMVKLSQ